MGKNKAGKLLDLKNLHHYPAQILNSQAVHPDPAASFPGAPPLFGKDVVPHIYTVAGWVGSQARAYPLEDEALRDSTENAERMRRHPDIKECLLARQRAVALLPWHLQPEDEHDPVQKQLVADLTSIVERTHRWVELRRNLMEAIWYGKGFVQLRYGVKQVKGRWRKVAAAWEPRHPDKILFRYSDGTNEYVPGQVGIRIHAGARGVNREQIEATQYGLAYWLRDFERRVCIVHKHEIEDGPFLDPRASGRIHGVGLRDSVYWTWYSSVEVEQKLLEYLDRTALGIEIWRYPSGNKEAEKQARAAAEERIGGGRSIVMVPVIPGEQADLFGVQHIEPGPQGAELLKTICQDFYAHKIKRLILGQTLTSEAESTGMGSGVADAHLATFSDIIRYDAVNLQESLTDDFIQILKEENFPWARGIHIRLILNTERPETQEKLAAYNEAWNMGLKVRAEDLYALIGARRPDDEDEVLQNPNIMMAEQQQAMMQMQMGAPPPGAATPGDPTQVAMGDAGPAVAAMGQPGAPPMEVEKSAAAEPGAQPVNPWAGFWDSLFAAARGQGVPPPAGTMPPAAPRPVDHMELTRLFQDRFREAIVTRRQTAAQFREALESAIASQPDRDNLNLRLGFLFAWKKAEPVQKIKAAFEQAITRPGPDRAGPPPVPPVATAAPADDDPVKQQLLDALAANPVKRAFQEAFERHQGPREELLRALRETVAPDQYAGNQAPWQMSKAEYLDAWKRGVRSQNEAAHEQAVKQAIADGHIKDHPDYPELSNPSQYTQGQEGIRGSSTAGTPVPPRDQQPDLSLQADHPVVEADRPAPLGVSMDDAIARYRAGEWTSEDLDRYALQRSFEMMVN
jgi:phage gp29-like protein